MKRLFVIFLSINAIIACGFAFIFRSKTDLNIVRVLWWNDTTARRVADFCARMDKRCVNREYFARHTKLLKRTRYFSELLDISMRLRYL
jgi:hypothetical protein